MSSEVSIIIELTYLLVTKGLQVPLLHSPSQLSLYNLQLTVPTRNNPSVQNKFPCVRKEAEINKLINLRHAFIYHLLKLCAFVRRAWFMVSRTM